MPRTCCIINCHNGDCDQRNFFVIPKDEERRREWFDAISPYLQEGRKSRKLLYVCDSHFKDDDVLRNTSIHLKDGSIDKIACFRVKLKPSSVPCIFNAKNGILPKIELPSSETKRSITVTSVGERQKKLAIEGNRRTEVTNTEAEKETRRLPDGERAYNLEMMEKDLKILWEKTNNRIWGSCMRPCGLLISFFGENLNVATKTILVKEDMSTEIRAAGKFFMNSFRKKIKCLDDILSVMAEVKKNHLCRGSDDSMPCPYDCFESSTKPSSGRCISCRIERKKKMNNLRRVKKRSEEQENKRKLLIRNLRRKNHRLVKNMASAKEAIEELKARLKNKL